MQHDSLSDRTLLVPAFPVGALPAAATAGTLVDTLGYDGVRFEISIGALLSAATLDAYVKRDSASAFTTSTNITGAALVQVTSSAANSNSVAVIDVYRPAQRYLKLVLTSAAASVAVAATASLYRRSGLLPPTQTALQVVKIAEG
jgi:hypothetical protein